MKIDKELILLRNLLHMTQKELADNLTIPVLSIKRWENNLNKIEEKNIDKIYNYAISKGIFFNDIFEKYYLEKCSNSNLKLLYHGCKEKLIPSLDLIHSKKENDFGVGFYLGETFKQAAIYTANSKSNKVYSYSLSLNNLKHYEFNINTEWMITISYFRGLLNKYSNSRYIKRLISKLRNVDIIIAPIADNRMFDIIDEFVDGQITDQQCQHALAATNLGMQYVIKTNKGLDNLKLLKEHYLSSDEKHKLVNDRLDNNLKSQETVKTARIKYRNKGKYIDELLI